jgi:uncharacterized protein YndB with AHSA1/START domain
MQLTASADTSAPPEDAWRAVVDVTTWPRWTTSMTTVVRLDEGPLRVGSRARIKQPTFPWLVWEVTDLRPGVEFTWATRSLGARTSGRHVVTRNPDGTTRITLELDQTGPLGRVTAVLLRRRVADYLRREAAGLKAASEKIAAGP